MILVLMCVTVASAAHQSLPVAMVRQLLKQLLHMFHVKSTFLENQYTTKYWLAQAILALIASMRSPSGYARMCV